MDRLSHPDNEKLVLLSQQREAREAARRHKLLAECKRRNLARRASEKLSKKRSHILKMLGAVRAGDRKELKRLRQVNPLQEPTQAELRGFLKGDFFMKMQVSMTYVSDIAMDNDTDWAGCDYFDGFHRWQTNYGVALGPTDNWDRTSRIMAICRRHRLYDPHTGEQIKVGHTPRRKKTRAERSAMNKARWRRENDLA